jgi:hypothetical protein
MARSNKASIPPHPSGGTLLLHHLIESAITVYLHTLTTFTAMDPSRVVYKSPATATILQAAEARRSIYGLKSESPVSDDVIESIIQVAVSHVPSSFNTQTSRVVLLLKAEHQIWDITLQIMEGLVASGTLPKRHMNLLPSPNSKGFVLDMELYVFPVHLFAFADSKGPVLC